jgi:hypothetical protein
MANQTFMGRTEYASRNLGYGNSVPLKVMGEHSFVYVQLPPDVTIASGTWLMVYGERSTEISGTGKRTEVILPAELVQIETPTRIALATEEGTQADSQAVTGGGTTEPKVTKAEAYRQALLEWREGHDATSLPF